MSDKVPDEMNNFSTSSKYFLFRSAILAYFGSNYTNIHGQILRL